MLDTPSSLPGWHKLGSVFDMDKISLDHLKTEFLRPSGSPTSRILEFLKAKYAKMTVRILIEGIHRIERDDIVKYICNWQWGKSNHIEIV